MNKEALLNYGISIVLGLAVFSAGFYFGYRNQQQQNETMLAKQNIGKVEIETLQKDNKNPNAQTSDKLLSSEKTNSIGVEQNIFWLIPGKAPNCPSEFPIKGKFDSPVNVFYTKENKFYDRVVPQVCFQSLEFARDTAGFIQKF